MPFTIKVDDLSSTDVQELIAEHLRGMHETSPPEYVHALAIEALCQPDVTMWTVWDGNALCGCGALKALNPHAGEIKSMRTKPGWLRKGVGQQVLDVIIRTACDRGYRELLLETGTGGPFEAALSLYRKNGFGFCGPFGSYVATDFNVFMKKELGLLRQATMADADELWRVRYAVTENVLPPGRLTDEDLRRELEDTGRGWVIEEGDGIAAFAIANAQSGNIWALFVQPASQGCGHGSRLHDVAVQWLRAQSSAVPWLTTAPDSRACGFYERRGWQRVGVAANGDARYELPR